MERPSDAPIPASVWPSTLPDRVKSPVSWCILVAAVCRRSPYRIRHIEARQSSFPKPAIQFAAWALRYSCRSQGRCHSRASRLSASRRWVSDAQAAVQRKAGNVGNREPPLVRLGGAILNHRRFRRHMERQFVPPRQGSISRSTLRQRSLKPRERRIPYRPPANRHFPQPVSGHALQRARTCSGV